MKLGRLAGTVAFAFAVVLAACNRTVPVREDGAAACAEGSTRCEETCVATRLDDRHCGACGRACSSTQACGGGSCLPVDCPDADCAARQVCSALRCLEKTCVGVQCAAGQTCYEGVCVAEACGSVPCSTGFVCVSGACVDAACIGVACPAGKQCSLGRCIQGCTAGLGCATNLGAPCKMGKVRCESGSPVCEDEGDAPAATACGTGRVCDGDGGCIACVEGLGCSTNPNPCKVGVSSCATGAQTCVDAPGNSAAGQGCGVNQVCDGAGACVGCTAAEPCSTNPNPCKAGVSSCATGAQTCVDGSENTAPGEVCGTNQVCDGTANCIACTADIACNTNQNKCRKGVTSCSGGSSACVDSTVKADPGTACGSNQVCNASGSCIACTASVSCNTNPDKCKKGVTSCSSGSVACLNGTLNADPGAVCGNNNQVCDGAGTCIACTAGDSCSTNQNKCKKGVTSCSGGSSACVDSTVNADPGAVCGNNQVCDGAGTCVGCTADQACSTNPSKCKAGVSSCATGAQTCVDAATNIDPGQPCGTNQVCDGAGSCVACTVNQLCATNPNVCKEGKTACGTGAPVCENSASNSPTGTACGGVNVCVAGVCRACTEHSDCGAGLNCVQGACYAPLATCAAIKAQVPSAADGEYLLKPSSTVLWAYCDMALGAALCTEVSGARQGRTRDASALTYNFSSVLDHGTGMCTLWAVREAASNYPLDFFYGAPLGTCPVLGFVGDGAASGCAFGYSNPGLLCGYPIADYYRYGNQCSGCALNNGTYTQYVLQGTMATATVFTDYAGNSPATCRTR